MNAKYLIVLVALLGLAYAQTTQMTTATSISSESVSASSHAISSIASSISSKASSVQSSASSVINSLTGTATATGTNGGSTSAGVPLVADNVFPQAAFLAALFAASFVALLA
ncbi:hypothetical protein CU097_011082 [Rhizopus azygosporus]|uniref:Uncharacterized protein n=1 Tax=Rhizopus azygosporus TaxID=86630 RepID=A0A367JRS1_RHIAZ|nr:hypothetical protein CU097_011082 [Rhizopus azygosporus]